MLLCDRELIRIGFSDVGYNSYFVLIIDGGGGKAVIDHFNYGNVEC